KDILPFDTSKTEFKLFIGYIIFTIYGSLYPFNLHSVGLPRNLDGWINFLLCNFSFKTSLGDVLTNFFLFVPFGFLGVRSMRSPFKPLYYTIIITILGALFAQGLQIAQFFVADRIPSLMDSLCNILGCMTAGAFGSVSRFRFVGGKRGQELWKSAPLVLMSIWIFSNLLPFVPTLDVGEIKQSLKPLLLHPEFNLLMTLKHMIGWLLFSYMYIEYSDKKLNTKTLSLIITATLTAKIFIENRVLGLPHVLGGGLAIILDKITNKKIYNPRILFFILFLFLTLDGLYPFDFKSYPQSQFHFIPFYGFLEGNLFITSYVVLKKMFFYGSLIWTLYKFNITWEKATIFCIVWSILIEIIQMWSLSHTPEITDPIVMFLMALWVKKNDPTKKVYPKKVYTGPERRRQRR
ncbi:MAG: VanZ family protein, partial [Desulfonauticus sp.]|nr:VanZ family protein [Desulfonauticus sp.]